MARFIAGLCVGIALAGVALAGSNALAPSPAPAAPPAETPGVPPAEVAKIREEAETLRRDLGAAEAKIQHLEAAAMKPAESPIAPPAVAESVTPEAKAKAAKHKAGDESRRLAAKVQAGKDLPDEVVAALGLDEAQKLTVNALFREEGPRMEASLRAQCAENPSGTVPREGGAALLIAALARTLEADGQKINDFFSKYSEDETYYFEDVVGPDSEMLKATERLWAARRETLAAAGPYLTEDQRARIEELLGRAVSFGGASLSWPGNILMRRPK